MTEHEDAQLARELFRNQWSELSAAERLVIEHALARLAPVRDPNAEFVVRRTLGQRASDTIARFGGSWTFIILFGMLMVAWAFLNTEILGPRHDAFDPYPYVFLNLVLSMLAALQAPIIMMSQNRQAARDRLEAEIDHEVNLRAELAVREVDDRLRAIATRLEEFLAQAGERTAR